MNETIYPVEQVPTKPKFSSIPKKGNPEDAALYRRLIDVHCSHQDKADPKHECCGKLTITRKSLVANCVKCGDSKMIIGKDGDSDAA